LAETRLVLGLRARVNGLEYAVVLVDGGGHNNNENNPVFRGMAGSA